jgi:ATP-dependent helicase HrpB
LTQRLDRFQNEHGSRAEAVKRLAARIAKLAGGSAALPQYSLGELLALAYPDRVAKRRDAKGENWLSVGGRGLRLDPASPLVSAQWLAVADMQGAASGARIQSAAAIDEGAVMALFAERIEMKSELRYDDAADRLEAKTRRRLGAILLSEGQGTVTPQAALPVLMQAVNRNGLASLPWPDSAISLRQRGVYAGETVLNDEELLSSAETWLAPALTGVTRLRDVPHSALLQAIENLIGWDAKQRIDRIAPRAFHSPAGSSHDIDYAAEAGPTVTLRVQALFGLDVHPVVGVDRIPLVLSLTSPAGRPIQTTRDLPAFWRGSWADVVKDMRGRYPKHNWPDTPWESVASLKTKKAQLRSG